MSERVSLIDGHIDGKDLTQCKECHHFNFCGAEKGWCDLYESVVRENYSCKFGRKESEVQGE